MRLIKLAMDVQGLKSQANDALLDEDYDLALDLFDKVRYFCFPL